MPNFSPMPEGLTAASKQLPAAGSGRK